VIRIPGNRNFSVPMSAFTYSLTEIEIYRTGSHHPEDMQFNVALCGEFVDPNDPAASIRLGDFRLHRDKAFRPLLVSVQQLSTLTGWTVPQVVARCNSGHRHVELTALIPLVGGTLNLWRDVSPPCHVSMVVQNVKVSRAFLWNKVDPLRSVVRLPNV
jgi:hypothetical protein